MDGLIQFVVSINKIALLAFVVVFGLLIFEIKQMVEEKKRKSKPVVPQFVDVVKSSPEATMKNSTPLPPIAAPAQKNREQEGKSPWLMIVIGIITLMGLIIVTVVTINTNIQKQKSATASVPIIRSVSSPGLKVYDANWITIENKKSQKALPGDKLFIGIETIVEADIDRARIKVNQKDWRIADITTLFNPQLKVYYKEYTVATGTAQLKIDAQLHSASDGWLGD